MKGVIQARDAGIQEFYRVGEYKSYVETHRFMENWNDKKEGLEDKKGALEGQEKGLLGDTIIK